MDEPPVLLIANGIAVHALCAKMQIALLLDINDRIGETVAQVLGVLDVHATQKLIDVLQSVLQDIITGPAWTHSIEGKA